MDSYVIISPSNHEQNIYPWGGVWICESHHQQPLIADKSRGGWDPWSLSHLRQKVN